MQTTLLGLAIAIILAIVAALAAPLVVDWNHYRSAFEAEASRLTGLSVRVNGTIDARILPTPLIKLHDVEAGAAGQEPRLRTGTLTLEVGLGPLLRGEIQASEVHLVAPEISLGLDRSGAIDWPALSPSFRPDALSISRLSVEDGKVILSDAASGASLVLKKIWFNGDIRSFAGPFKGDGAFVVGDDLYGYRISGSRVEDDGGLRIRLGVDPSDRPLTTDIDGTFTLDRGVPQFDGMLALARPVGATLASGRRVMSEPWRGGGRIHATPAAVSLQDATFQYGPDERPINLAGKAELTFGEHPHLDGTISGLQLDVDRALAAPDVTHRPPLIVLKNFAEAVVAAVKLPVPARIGIEIDAVTVGGTTVQSLHGDVSFDRTGWSLDRFAFRAPGLTQVNLSGRLADTPQGLTFSGPATLDAADVNMLLAWLKGHSDMPSGEARTLTARGDVSIGNDRMAVDRLSAAFDQENVEGRLAYSWADKRPAVLEVELRAAQLDLDKLSTFTTAVIADHELALPRQGTLALDIGQATFAGVAARVVKAQVKIDAGILQIDRLSIGELGGAALEIGGRIEELSTQPRGRLTFDLDARVLAGLTDVIGRFAPQSSDWLRRFADRLAPAKVHAVVTVARGVAADSVARLELSGQMGLMRVAFNGEATGKSSAPGDAAVRIDSRLDADDGSALVALFGLDRVLAVDQLPGRLTLAAVGPLDGAVRVDGRLSASGLDTAVQGKVRLGGEKGSTGTFQVLASAADLRPLHRMMTGQSGAAIPVSARAALTIGGAHLSFTDMAVAVNKASLRGRLALDLTRPVGIDGDIEADDVDAASVAAMLLGLPAVTPDSKGLWSSAPLGAGAFAAMNGAVTFKLGRAAFTPALAMLDLKGVARFRPAEIAVEDIDGNLAGGHVGGALTFHRDADGLAAHGSIALTGANAGMVLAPGKNTVDGVLTLKLECDSSGQSPAGLIGGLRGSGTVALTDAHIAGIDPAAFDAAIRTADQNGSAELPKIQAVVSAAMANGRLAVTEGDAPVTVVSGRANLANVTLQAQDGAVLSLNSVLDLNTATIDARMTLSVPPPANALIRMRPELGVALKGPFTAPVRVLDTSALTGWLTLRAAELQTRRIESIEANRRDAARGPVTRPESPVVRAAPFGSMVESAIPANVPAAPAASVRGLDRLQPEAPAIAPDGAHSDLGNFDRARPASSPPVSAPRTAGPDKRSPLDLLFRPQN